MITFKIIKLKNLIKWSNCNTSFTLQIEQLVKTHRYGELFNINKFISENLSSANYIPLKGKIIIIIENNNNIIGIARSEKCIDKTYYISCVFIKDTHRKKGYCYKILHTLIKSYSKKYIFKLDVLSDNINALKCYSSLDFKIIKKYLYLNIMLTSMQLN